MRRLRRRRFDRSGERHVTWIFGACPAGDESAGTPQTLGVVASQVDGCDVISTNESSVLVAWGRLSESESGVYAIVRSGGRQHKVAVGDIVEIDRVVDEVGSSITLQPLMLVDGDDITTAQDTLGKASVTAEVLGEVKGPKIRILKYKNKTGYTKRQGHRQKYTQVKVTGIEG